MNSRKMSIDNFFSRFQDYFCFKYISRKTCKEALCLEISIIAYKFFDYLIIYVLNARLEKYFTKTHCTRDDDLTFIYYKKNV